MFAHEFDDIPEALSLNAPIRYRFLRLVQTDPIVAKVTQEADRLGAFRSILLEFGEGQTSLSQAIASTQQRLDPTSSAYSSDKRVFAKGWSERHVRTQVSRFYNQAVLESLNESGCETCFVPPSSREKPDSPCTLAYAGKLLEVRLLYDLLTMSYREGNWASGQIKIPDHPHCTHVVRPTDEDLMLLVQAKL